MSDDGLFWLTDTQSEQSARSVSEEGLIRLVRSAKLQDTCSFYQSLLNSLQGGRLGGGVCPRLRLPRGFGTTI